MKRKIDETKNREIVFKIRSNNWCFANIYHNDKCLAIFMKNTKEYLYY